MLKNKAGIVDLENCIEMIKQTKYDNISIIGYSHGGFLTGHLSAELKI